MITNEGQELFDNILREMLESGELIVNSRNEIDIPEGVMMLNQKLADAIYQGTNCDPVVAEQVAENLIKEGWTQVDRDAKPPILYVPMDSSDYMDESFAKGAKRQRGIMLGQGWVKEMK